MNDQADMWSDYWRSNRIATCAAMAGENYGPALVDGWRRFFRELRSGSRILDLCTGNGAIPLLAVEVARVQARAFHLTGVDKADIRPSIYVAERREDLKRINFVSGMDVANLPFDDTSFDAITSQYGIEYADLDGVVASIGRVLSLGGRFRAVIHAEDGYMVGVAKRDIPDCHYLLEESGLFRAARRALEAAWRLDHGEEDKADRVRSSYADYSAIHRDVADRAGRAGNPQMFSGTLIQLADAYAGRGAHQLATLQGRIDHAAAQVTAHLGRLQAMVDAAMDKGDVRGLIRKLEGAGLTRLEYTPHESGEDGDHIGWVVTGMKG